MFVTNYAVLSSDNTGKKIDPSEPLVLAVADILDEKSKIIYAHLHLKGTLFVENALIISDSQIYETGNSKQIVLPDIPDNILVDLRKNGVVIFDLGTLVKKYFEVTDCSGHKVKIKSAS